MQENKFNNLHASEYAFQQNKERANIQMSKMLLATGISLLVVWTMYLFHFLTTTINPWIISGSFLGASLILVGLWYLCGKKYYNKPWSKYAILITILLIAGSIMTFDIIFSLLFFALVIVVACRYYDSKFLTIITVCCLVVLVGANLIAAFSKPMFSDTNSVANWLSGREGSYITNIFVRLVIPEALGLLLVAVVGAYVSLDGKLILQEQEKIFAQKAQTEVELANSTSLLMISQIQPHFLFNTLSSIYYLCDKDVDEAKDAIDKFSTFLRMNVDTLSNKELIPVKKELEHIEIYLSLEKIRFEERLNYVFKIDPIDFLVPPLSIQPIVENAVKHGVTKRREGGTITIVVTQNDDNYIIVVDDDGVGFDYNSVNTDGKVHVGLSNIQQRLESMCHAIIATQSTIGKGTRVTICIPKEKGEEVE